MIHHDNAPAHTSIKLQQFLAQNNNIVVGCHSPYLIIYDFFLISRMKMKLKRFSFDSIEEVQEQTRNVLEILKTVDSLKTVDLLKALKQWKDSLDCCISFQREWSPLKYQVSV